MSEWGVGGFMSASGMGHDIRYCLLTRTGKVARYLLFHVLSRVR